jgi:hypothetical protein
MDTIQGLLESIVPELDLKIKPDSVSGAQGYEVRYQFSGFPGEPVTEFIQENPGDFLLWRAEKMGVLTRELEACLREIGVGYLQLRDLGVDILRRFPDRDYRTSIALWSRGCQVRVSFRDRVGESLSSHLQTCLSLLHFDIRRGRRRPAR